MWSSNEVGFWGNKNTDMFTELLTPRIPTITAVRVEEVEKKIQQVRLLKGVVRDSRPESFESLFTTVRFGDDGGKSDIRISALGY
jgi:hypothetical protein